MDRTLKQYGDILRNDLVAFAERAFAELYGTKELSPNWHIELIAQWLEAVRLGDCTRLGVCLPPRHFKSFMASVVWVAFILGHNPAAEILCISYGEKLSDDLAWLCRRLMQTPFYQALFPRTRLATEALDEMRTTAGGFRRARSFWGGITGGGADIIIIDDPHKPDDATSDVRRTNVIDVFYNTIYSRLNHKETGSIVIIMQRLHTDDLIANVVKNERWDLLSLPAIAETDECHLIKTPYGERLVTRLAGEALHPARESLTRLKQLRATLPPQVFSANYQQRPMRPEGAHIQRSWLKFDALDQRPQSPEAVIQSWDTALKTGEEHSYSVCTTWIIDREHFYLMDVFRQRVHYNALKAAAIRLAETFRPTAILIEEQASGYPLLQELKDRGLPAEAAPDLVGGKEERLLARINKFAGGFVHLPREAWWLENYVEEIVNFPHTKFSDQVDSTVYALAWASTGGNRSFTNGIGYLKLQAEAEGISLDGKPILVKIRNTRTGGSATGGRGAGIAWSKDQIIEVSEEDAMALCAKLSLGFERVWEDGRPRSTGGCW